MCEPTEFRLCSCGEIEHHEAGWILQRKDTAGMWLGQTMHYIVPDDLRGQADLIIQKLNAGEAFDFEHQAQDGDELLVRWGDQNGPQLAGGDASDPRVAPMDPRVELCFWVQDGRWVEKPENTIGTITISAGTIEEL